MKHDNPCFDCPESGCGRHAECEQYLEYYNRCKDRNKQKLENSQLNDYTRNAILRHKSGLHSTASRYRPKER